MVPAIILAAGASSRMGRPKALLRDGDRTFAARIIETLESGGITRAAIVLRPGVTIPDLSHGRRSGFVTVVINSEPDAGQLSSLLVGLNEIDRPGVDAALVTLVDIPLLTAATVRALVQRAAEPGAAILRATYHGRHGHPVIFRRETFAALRAADPAVGAKAVFAGLAVEDVEVEDAGIVEDIDTPADYTRVIESRQPNSPSPGASKVTI